MEGYIQGHVERNKKTFYFVYPKSTIFVPDTEKMSIPMALSSEIFIDETLEIP